MLDGTDFVFPCENVLPEILPDATGVVIAETRREEPIAEILVLVLGEGEEAVAGNGELGTAGLGEDFGHLREGEQFVPGLD